MKAGAITKYHETGLMPFARTLVKNEAVTDWHGIEPNALGSGECIGGEWEEPTPSG